MPISAFPNKKLENIIYKELDKFFLDTIILLSLNRYVFRRTKQSTDLALVELYDHKTQVLFSIKNM